MTELRSRLKGLANSESTYPHIFTAYLNLREGGQDRKREAHIFLKNRASEINHVLAGDERAKTNLRQEMETITRILDQDVPKSTAGLALFLRSGEVLERFDVSVPFDNQVAYRRVPHIAQLAFIDEELEAFAIVALDSRSATIFDVALGVVSDHKAEIENDVHRRIHAGGWSQMRFQRHIDNQKREHLEEIAENLSALVSRFNYKRIMLVGPNKSTSKLIELLPKHVQARVIERKAVDSRAGDKKIVDEALTYFAKAENEEEAAKIKRVQIEIHSSGMAVAGVDNVLRCIEHGKVHELLLGRDFNEIGVECLECGSIAHGATNNISQCPTCDAPEQKLKDIELREVFTRKSLQYGFKIEFIKLPEFEEVMGNVAALLHSPNT